MIVAIKPSLHRKKGGGHVQGLTEEVCLIRLAEECRADHFMESDEIESLKGFRGSLESKPPVTITPLMDIEDGDPETIVLPWCRYIECRRQDRAIHGESGSRPTPTGMPEHASQRECHPGECFAES